MREPFRCSIKNIALLTSRQLRNIYFRPDEKKKEFELKDPPMTFQQIFKKRARICGKQDEEIKQKWHELYAKEYGEWEND